MSHRVPPSSNNDATPDSGPESAPQFNVQWAAGFLDGEGCIHIAKQRYRTRRRDSYRLGVHLTQNDLEVLEHFRAGIGIAAPIYQVKRLPEHRRQCYTLNYSNANAMRLINMLTPHLVRKRREAEAAQSFWTEGRIGERPGAAGLAPEVVEVREFYFRLLKQLK